MGVTVEAHDGDLPALPAGNTVRPLPPLPQGHTTPPGAPVPRLAGTCSLQKAESMKPLPRAGPRGRQPWPSAAADCRALSVAGKCCGGWARHFCAGSSLHSCQNPCQVTHCVLACLCCSSTRACLCAKSIAESSWSSYLLPRVKAEFSCPPNVVVRSRLRPAI